MSSSGEGNTTLANSTSAASQACGACKRQKRKCDKLLPACSLCTRMGRPCDYSDSIAAPNSEDFTALRNKVHDLEQRLSGVSSTANTSGGNGQATQSWTTHSRIFPSMFFLDSYAFDEARLSVPRPSLPVPGEVLTLLGDINDFQGVVDTYFSTIHNWLAVVSKTRLYQQVNNPSTESSADLALLFLCMKLVVHVPFDDSGGAEDNLYQAAKQFLHAVESGGLLTVKLMQAAVLISAYELGHGIYPAAFLSTGHAARLGQAMGLHDRRTPAPQMLRTPATWTLQEEMRRVWWAVLILDRYVNLGGSGRPLASEDPASGDVLPSDDDHWNRSEMTTSEPVFVSSTTAVKVTPFARTCQVAHLTGRVIRHRNDKNIDVRFRFSEALQLYRTISALASYLPAEFESDPERMTTSMALCYSTLLALCDPYSCTDSNHGLNTVEETEMQGIAISGLQSISNDVYQLSLHLRPFIDSNLDGASPLITDCIYQAAATKLWLYYESGAPEAADSLRTLREMLETINGRWKIAGEYLKVLEISESAMFGGEGHSEEVRTKTGWTSVAFPGPSQVAEAQSIPVLNG